jgi:hypothetical protein
VNKLLQHPTKDADALFLSFFFGAKMHMWVCCSFVWSVRISISWTGEQEVEKHVLSFFSDPRKKKRNTCCLTKETEAICCLTEMMQVAAAVLCHR